MASIASAMVNGSCMNNILDLLYINVANLSCLFFSIGLGIFFLKSLLDFLSDFTIHIYLDLFIHSHDTENHMPHFNYDGWCSIQQKTKKAYYVALLFHYIYYFVLSSREDQSSTNSF